MNAIAGPEPSAMSRLSEAIACCMRASPVKAIASMSRPCFAKKPLRMPMSRGTNENASGTALPTRSVSAAPTLRDKGKAPATSRSATAISKRKAAVVRITRLRIERLSSSTWSTNLRSFPRKRDGQEAVINLLRQLPLQQPLGVTDEDLAAVGLRNVEPLDDVDGRGDRAERRVGCKHHVLGAEEFEPAAHR